MTTSEEQIVPESVIDAEKAAIGAALLSKAAREQISEIVTDADFYRPAHKTIFAIMCEIGDAGTFVDATILSTELNRRGELARCGGGPYLHDLVSGVANVVNGAYYARIVRRDARRRKLLEAGIYAQQIASRPDFEEADMDAARDAVDQATADVETKPFGWLWETLPEFIDQLDKPLDPGELVPAPYADLAFYVPGFRPGQLVTVGARPSIGKTVIGMDIARTAAIRHNLPTYVASLEMSENELKARIIAAEARVELQHLQRDPDHLPTEEQWQRIARHFERIRSAPIVIDDSSGCTVSHIRSRLRGMARAGHPPRLVVVDYLQLMTMPRAESRERAVAETAWKLKMLAKEFEIPVVVLAQLNRKVEDRHDKTPQLSDLRESGAVEQDSDVVLMLHRPDFYEPETTRAGEMDVIVAKNRAGRKGTATVAFQGKYTRAVDMAAGRNQ